MEYQSASLEHLSSRAYPPRSRLINFEKLIVGGARADRWRGPIFFLYIISQVGISHTRHSLKRIVLHPPMGAMRHLRWIEVGFKPINLSYARFSNSTVKIRWKWLLRSRIGTVEGKRKRKWKEARNEEEGEKKNKEKDIR